MKQCLIFLFIIIHFMAIGQKSIAYNMKSNFVYNGVEMPIKIILPRYDYDSIITTVSHGEWRKKMNNEYIWRVCEPKKTFLFIYITALKTDSIIYQDTINFFLKFIPEPIAFIACGRKTLQKKELHDCNGISAITDMDYQAYCEVETFQISLVRSGKLIKQVENKGSTFEKETKKLLKKAKIGDQVIFSSIQAHCNCDGFQRELKEITIIIK